MLPHPPQTMLMQEVDFTDTENVMSSPGLDEFAAEVRGHACAAERASEGGGVLLDCRAGMYATPCAGLSAAPNTWWTCYALLVQSGLWDPANGTFNFFKVGQRRQVGCSGVRQGAECMLHRSWMAAALHLCCCLSSLPDTRHPRPSSCSAPRRQAYMEDGWRDPLANYIRVCILTQVCSQGCAVCSCAAPVQPDPALCCSWRCSCS